MSKRVFVSFFILITVGVSAAIGINWHLRKSELTPREVLIAKVGGSDLCAIGGTEQRTETAGVDIALALGTSAFRASLPILTAYLKKLANSTTSEPRIAASQVDLFRMSIKTEETLVNSSVRCFVLYNGIPGKLVQGSFPPWLQSEERRQNLDPEGLFLRNSAGGDQVENLTSLGLLDFPTSYFEFAVEEHATGEAIRFRPTVIYFRDPIAESGKSSSKNIEITLTFLRPSHSGGVQSREGNNVLLQIPLVIRGIVASAVNQARTASLDAIWSTPVPAPDRETTERLAHSLRTRRISEAGIVPTNALVTYREVGRPDVLFEFLAVALQESSQSLNSSFESILRQVLRPEQASKP